MLARDATAQLHHLSEILSSSFLITRAKEIALNLQEIEHALTPAVDAGDTSTAWNSVAAARTLALKATDKLRHDVQSVHTAQAISELKQELGPLKRSGGICGPPFLDDLLDSIGSFEKALEQFLRLYEPASTLQLMRASSQLVSQAQALQRVAKTVGSALGSSDPDDVGPDEAVLTLVLSQDVSLSDLVLKIEALTTLYEAVVLIMGGTTSEYPLRLYRAETDSVLLKVIGWFKATPLMQEFLLGGARYIYRNYTTEGRIRNLPSKLDALNGVLDFTQRLEEAGLDVSEAHGELVKAARAVSREVSTLVTGSVKIEVNAETVEIGAEDSARYLEDSKARLLTAGSEEEEEVD